jgi:hypothetical protein
MFSKKAQISSFIKIRPVGAELFHANRRTDMKLTVAFRNYANAPNYRDINFYFCSFPSNSLEIPRMCSQEKHSHTWHIANATKNILKLLFERKF